MRQTRVPHRVLAGAFVVSTTLAVGSDGRAAWPPAPNTDPSALADPAYWPDDPGYAYRASATPGDRRSGQWPLYSFVPERSPGATALRSGETSAGMSVDLAWRRSIGDPRVVIAVLDSGIDWAERDLVDKVVLDPGELGRHLPHHADGSDCAPLDPAQASENLFDCNGDGVLTVSDYAQDPSLSTRTDPPGDVNHNGILDAEDLILAFSDGVDDDADGYVDDIAGWDFAANDADPFDDTATAHGTTSALLAAAQTNDGIGVAGACPKCRVLPVRVGSGATAEAAVLAKALAFAADAGSSVALTAVTSVDSTAFLQASVDYAASAGVTVVASMGTENSRHHAQPASLNHVVAVSALGLTGTDSTSAASFVAFDTCSNFGAQMAVAGASGACADEAAAYVAGVVGLGYSMALSGGFDPSKNGGLPKLGAGELDELVKMTADDVNVAESQEPQSPYFASEPGFDQRFGYGRANADRMLAWIAQKKIPPTIDVSLPEWFAVLDPERLGAPVKILGSVGAPRAASYDYSVAWAPGVEPLDGEFHTIASVPNVAGTITSGADGVSLADLDVRELDVTHARDSSSPLGENDLTITLRVRATAHYGGTIGDVPGELRRAVTVHADPDLLSGFPLKLPASGESSPKLADIDGDGVRDVVIATADGKVAVYRALGGDPVLLPGFPVALPASAGLSAGSSPDYTSAPAYRDGKLDVTLAGEPIVASPAIGDLDGDGSPEIVVATTEGSVFAIEHDGAPRAGFPVTLPPVVSCPTDGSTPPDLCATRLAPIARGVLASPVLADFDGKGTLSIVIAALDGFVHVFDADGSERQGWPIRVHFPEAEPGRSGPILSTPVVADFNGDAVPDVLVGSGETLGPGGDNGAYTIIDGRASDGAAPYLGHWPVTVTSLNLQALVAQGTPAAPAAADFDHDGRPEAVFHGNGSGPLILPADPGVQTELSALPPNALPSRENPDGGVPLPGLDPGNVFGKNSNAVPDTFTPLFGQPSIGDLDQDGVPDVVAIGASASVARDLFATRDRLAVEQHLLGMWSGRNGHPLPASPAVLEDFGWLSNPAIADITDDGYPEILVGTGGYALHALDACGREAPGWPKHTGQWIAASPAVGDVTGDGHLNVVAVTRDGWLYAWRTLAPTSAVIAWESFHHDNRNTGVLETPLDQGTLLGAREPLALDEAGGCLALTETPDGGAVPSVVPSGGCRCALACAGSPFSAWAAACVALLVSRRRRFSRS